MKKMNLLVIAILFIVSLSSTGCVYLKIKAPLDKDVNQTELGTKIGKADSQCILWLVCWGDAGTRAAAENGGITVIRHMDTEYMAILFGVYSKRSTIAYGD